jgi:hypothetical protein
MPHHHLGCAQPRCCWETVGRCAGLKRGFSCIRLAAVAQQRAGPSQLQALSDGAWPL